jgi:hypothetical protein
MDAAKCERLKAELSGQERPAVPIERYFDGNDDEASIGCNLPEHPGMDAFRAVLVGLTRRPDVEAVYALIAEVDPGEDFWPYTDTVVVFGTIKAEDLEHALGKVEPDEVSSASDFGVADELLSKHSAPALAAWWD